MRWIVHKFGGSSLAGGNRIAAVGRLLGERPDEAQAVVVSAMAGVTDGLIELTRLAAAGNPLWPDRLEDLRRRHLECAHALLGGNADGSLETLETRFQRLKQLLEGLELLGSAPAEAVELISGLGEVWSAELFAGWFRQAGEEAAFVDAREVLRIQATELYPAVDWPETRRRMAAFLEQQPARRLVITGYICRDADDRITTLGRNGSDYSASIFANLLDAAEVHIWTDVDGVLSADPKRVPQALVMPHLSYREAFELAYFGARVIHPRTMAPATEKAIPIYIRNPARPDQPGTRIDAAGSPEPPVKGITSIDGMALVNIEGAGMMGVPGTAERVFAALRDGRISVTMISQGSSEHSICCVLPEADSGRAVALLRAAFARELDLGQLQGITATSGIQVLAAVGDGMAGTPGVAGRLFSALGRAGINVRAIAQGASERNISVAVDAAEATRALRTVHAGFYLSEQTLSVGLIGPGQVGRALLAQLNSTRSNLLENANLDLRIRGLANSARMELADRELSTAGWSGRLDSNGPPVNLDAFAAHIQADHLPHAVMIDCTASDRVADYYADWLASGIHVITPNKHAGSGELTRYQRLRTALGNGTARWRYEATVGAGLPVIQTLRDLIDTGDRIQRIEGIFSGTLAYLFNRFEPGMSFASLVAEARAAGYTEPDPRDDLSGTDVARKLVILGRETGLEISLDDVEVESLVPAELSEDSIESFLAGLGELDPGMGARVAKARQSGQVLRHVGRLNAKGTAQVRMEAFEAGHPFANLALTDNVVAFTTERYRDNPLIIQGPGAGPDVTATGVFADLLRVAAGLGARL